MPMRCCRAILCLITKILLLAIPLYVYGQSNEKDADIIKFNEQSHDFGVIKQFPLPLLSYELILKNVGQRKVGVAKVLATCSCTACRQDFQNLKAGEQGKIAVTVSLGEFVGDKHSAVRIIFQDGSYKDFVLHAQVPDRVETYPPYPSFELQDNKIQPLRLQIIRKTMVDSQSSAEECEIASLSADFTAELVNKSVHVFSRHKTIVHTYIIRAKARPKDSVVGPIKMEIKFSDGFDYSL